MSYVNVNGVILDSVRLSRHSKSILSTRLLRMWNLPVVSHQNFFIAAYKCGVNCGGTSIDFLISEDLSEDICLGSDWYTFLRHCRFLHETYGSDSILCGDIFTDRVDALASSSFVSPHITTSCPVPGIGVASLPTQNFDNALPEEVTTSFIDDTADECYATMFASSLRIAYTERPHLGYLQDLLFGLSDDVPHLHILMAPPGKNRPFYATCYTGANGTKISCQWPNDEDPSKCRECHLQAKRCVPGGGNITKTSRKQRQASESPLPRTTRRKLVLDDDDDKEEEDEDEENEEEEVPLPPKKNPLPKPAKPTKPSTSMNTPTKPSTSNNTVRPRPSLNVMKPSVIIPKTDMNLWSTATTSSTSSAKPFAQKPSTSFPNPFASKGPVATKPPAVPSLQLLMDKSVKVAENMPEGSPFDGEPDADEVKRIVAKLADLDRDGYKVELAKTIIRLDLVLKRNELIIEGLKTFASKETAILGALKKKEEDSHRAIMDMLNTLS
ncbi:uncharacterized protein ARMOST_14147 [Armillaria ostoyae]|uniref:Uncharacterized protein n=1 Tax=Armillaria ostoyae TaxID=47428 RepID=A0A284RPT5_ARMOS|nr:uncharacterized protein ARMOST_14147 [Armillaria ostoyae]